ncbi:MAG TPA: hypothetical protein PKA00_09950, partial [Saprospiraceae bacterium]|nr:hypothetical protein [Saprospiraceae bacterium]
VIDGILYFENPSVFKQAIETFNSYSQASLDDWENRHHFISIRALYNKADEAYETYLLNDQMANFYQDWSKVAIPNAENTGPTPYFGAFISTFLNEDYQLMIGDCLHQFSANEVTTYCGLSPKEVKNLELEKTPYTEQTVIFTNGIAATELENRNTVTKSCVTKSNNNNNGSYSWETEMKLTEVKIAVGNGSYIRVGDVRLEAVSKVKKWYGWVKDGADLTMDGPIHVGDVFGENWDTIVDEGPTFTRELVKFYDDVAIGSNDNKQNFIDPTSVTFTSSKVPGRVCVLED